MTDRLLFVGRLNAQKGIEHLVAALPLVRNPVALDVVGDRPERARLQQFARDAGVAERITWHGSLPQTALAPFYRGAAALVVPSIDEGLGLVAVEAQLCGTPVIASESGGLPDIVRHDQTGILVPPAEPAALASAVDSLLARPDKGASLGEAGRMHALATFAPESVARRYATLYRSLLESASR
jgi:glycosyltransferase involved in cell wall biosynthesis